MVFILFIACEFSEAIMDARVDIAEEPPKRSCPGLSKKYRIFLSLVVVVLGVIAIVLAIVFWPKDPNSDCKSLYSFEKCQFNYRHHYIYCDYEYKLTTKEHGIEFYVKSPEKFDKTCPVGTPARARVENRIIKNYKDFAQRECDNEEKVNLKRPDFPTPICDKLKTLGMYDSLIY